MQAIFVNLNKQKYFINLLVDTSYFLKSSRRVLKGKCFHQESCFIFTILVHIMKYTSAFTLSHMMIPHKLSLRSKKGTRNVIFYCISSKIMKDMRQYHRLYWTASTECRKKLFVSLSPPRGLLKCIHYTFIFKK